MTSTRLFAVSVAVVVVACGQANPRAVERSPAASLSRAEVGAKPSGARAAKGMKCNLQNSMLTVAEAAVVSVAGFPDGYCYAFPLRGTLNGTYTSCILQVGSDGMSFFELGPWGEPAFSAYWDEWIDTKDGRLHLHSYGVLFMDSGVQGGLSRVVPEGSTGKFASASGQMGLSMEWNEYTPGDPFVGGARLVGTICTP